MTKLEQMVNDFYATEGLTLEQHVEIIMELPKEEVTGEFKNLFAHLNREIG